jgi:hypothetical protein
VQLPESFGFVDIRLPFVVGELFPTASEQFADLRVMSFRVNFIVTPSFDYRPNHERVQRPTHVLLLLLLLLLTRVVTVAFGSCRLIVER